MGEHVNPTGQAEEFACSPRWMWQVSSLQNVALKSAGCSGYDDLRSKQAALVSYVQTDHCTWSSNYTLDAAAVAALDMMLRVQ
jgi:hypothetical protein